MIDDISLKILWDRLVSVTNEASLVLKRSAFSTLVRECNDFACSLMTLSGETLSIADASLPSFSTTQSITLQECLKKYPLDQWREGDMLITNDPWIGTGQVMDLTILKPVFVNGRPVAFTGSVAHSPDLGGLQRWNGAKDVFEEGLHIPPMFLYREGKQNEVLFGLISANSRIPNETIGDLMAQIASHEVSERRLSQIMQEHNLDVLDEVVDEICRRSESAIRQAISDVPDGTYSYEVMTDGSRGGPFDQMIQHKKELETIAVRVQVRVMGSDIEVDWGGSSEQVEPPINSVYPFTFAYTAYALRLLLIPHIPQNGGFIRPISVKAKPGTVMNAAFPAATLNRGVIGHLVCDSIFGALSDVLPDRVRAMSGSTPLWQFIIIGDDEAGQPYQRIIPLNGGLGATAAADGVVCSFPANLTNVQTEILEATTPIRLEEKSLIRDSAGVGEWRGGYGVRSRFRALSRALYSLTFSRVDNAPRGFLGGKDGRRGNVHLNGEELRPGAEGVLEPGDVIVFETPGGGGIGDPAERDAVRVANDVNHGVISKTVAMRYHGWER